MIGKNVGALETFMKVLRKEMNKTEASLQVEESGTKIAHLQGKCAGYRSLCKILVESGYLDYTEQKETMDGIVELDKENEWFVNTSDYHTLLEWHLTSMDIEEIMSEIKKPFEKRVEKMKDKLFYEAEKGRDLHFVKGWYFILAIFDDWCAAINSAYEVARQQKERELPFDDEEERDPFDIG